jgi:predicted secreted hydrolase
MFQEIFSSALTLVPVVFYAATLNSLWLMLTGQRMSTKEHGKVWYFTQEAFCMQQSVDVTGDALAQTPWMQYFAPYYTGFIDLIESSHNMHKYMELIPCLGTLKK